MTPPKILVAGLGNIFFGDDAFGVEVIRLLAQRSIGPNVTIKDFGIRSFDLSCSLAGGYDFAILVDVVQRGEPPGTLYVIEPEVPTLQASLDFHQSNPARALELARQLGSAVPSIRIVGCEPACFNHDDGISALSPAVQASLTSAVHMVEGLVSDFLSSRTVYA